MAPHGPTVPSVGVRCAPAIFIAPTAGATFWNLSSSVTANGTCAAIPKGMPLLPRPIIDIWPAPIGIVI